MATTMTAVPRPDSGTVLLTVTAPAAESPRDVLALTAGQIKAEGLTAWTGMIQRVDLFGDLAAFYSQSANERITRTITGLTVGQRTRVTFTAQRTALPTTFGVTGKGQGTIPAGSGVWAHSMEFVATATSHQVFLDLVQNNLPYLSRLTVTILPAAYSYATFALTRTDANGVRPVRLLDRQEIVGGSLIIEDAEAALTGTITYQLRSALGETTTVSTTLDGTPGYRLAPAVFPQWAVTVGMVTGYHATRTTSTAVHEVIGRPDPVLRLGALKLRRGTLTIWCDSYDALTAALGVYQRGEVVLLRQGDYAGLDMYHVATETREEGYDAEHRRWRLDVTYVEVAVPRGPLLGSPSWTWDDLAAMFPTWDAVTAFFATWNAAQIGPS